MSSRLFPTRYSPSLKDWTSPVDMGKPVFQGRLTDQQIVDFYVRQSCDGYGKQAIEELARTEHKSTAEVLEILHSHGVARKIKEEDIATMSYVKFSPELRAQVISDKAEGMKYAEIADKNGITVKQVSNILAVNSAKKRMAAEAEEIVKFVEELTTHKNEPASVTELNEEQAERFANAIERSKAEQTVIPAASAPAGEINMYAALLALQEFAENELARGSKSFSYIETSMFKDKYATVRFEFDGGEYVLNLDKALVRREVEMKADKGYRRRKSYINSRAFNSVIWETFARQGDCHATYYERCGEDEYAHVLINRPADGKTVQETATTDISGMELSELLIAVVESIDKHFREVRR